MKVRIGLQAAGTFDRLPRRIQIEILEELRQVSRFPSMRPVRRLGTFRGFRYFICRRWLVFYRFSNSEIEVLGILHGMMDEA